ncbi:hypothetical protein [Nocardioides alcanivorans]|uniref:hypothetical protein n=1 Tax=Nocardioides alcanivorans TaxID=2897352 RepID=UPI001F319EEB|nr:hypothetical protein [Nocardioides alcanivorans]
MLTERTHISDPTGRHRVLDEAPVLPQAAQRLDDSPLLTADEVLLAVERINLDAASYRQLAEASSVGRSSTAPPCVRLSSTSCDHEARCRIRSPAPVGC